MTNEELDRARAEEAAKRIKNLGTYGGSLPVYLISAITEAARLAREGWTPPVAVDPDLLEARKISGRINRDAGHPSFAYGVYLGNEDNSEDVLCALAGIKRGRALATAEAKPGMVWVKHDGKGLWPVRINQSVCVWYRNGGFAADRAADICWPEVTHYAEITPPEDVA